VRAPASITNQHRVRIRTRRLRGRAAAERVDGREEPEKNKNEPPPAPLLLPPKGLVVRESTDFFAVDNPVIAAALAYIADNSHRPIGASDVALAADVGLRTMQREFSHYVGRPISAEIQRVRIERAKRELADSDHSIQEIARKVGFGPATRIYEVFRRELGVTPREYRKQRQVEGEA
jgi:LacI family transcriptional regulator